MSEYWQRAWRDTKSQIKWAETVLGGAVTGAITYGVLSLRGSEEAAMEELIAIAVAILTGGFFIPATKLCWNRIQAPTRIANDQITLLRGELDSYKSAHGIELVRVGNDSVEGRWYGNKFVLDNPKLQFNTKFSVPNEGNGLFYVECPPHSLAHLAISMSESSKLHFSKPGADSHTIVEGSDGTVEVPVDGHSRFEMWVEWGRGDLSVYLLAWTKAGS